MVYHSISEFTKAKMKWQNTLSIIHPDGNVTVVVRKKTYSLKEYLTHNTPPVYMPDIPENPDGTKIQGGRVTKKST